jgi:hypothetical protein
MDIFTVVVVFLVIEAGICGICSFVCRERQVPSEIESPPKRTSHHPAADPPRTTHGVDHQDAWSDATDQQPDGQDSNVHLICFPSCTLF